jgi:hypothetical protein
LPAHNRPVGRPPAADDAERQKAASGPTTDHRPHATRETNDRDSRQTAEKRQAIVDGNDRRRKHPEAAGNYGEGQAQPKMENNPEWQATGNGIDREHKPKSAAEPQHPVCTTSWRTLRREDRACNKKFGISLNKV